MIQRLLIRLASPFAGLLLLAALAGYCVISVTIIDPHGGLRHALLHTPWGVGALTLFVLNLLCAAFMTLLSQGSRVAAEPSLSPALPLEAPADESALREFLSRRGYRITHDDAQLLKADKGRLSFIAGVVFRVALSLLIASLAAGNYLSTRESGILSSGGAYHFTFGDVTLRNLQNPPSGQYLDTGESAAFKLNDLRAELTVAGHPLVLSGAAPSDIMGQRLSIRDLGLLMTISNGTATTSTALELFPPGKAQSVSITELSNKPVRIALAPGKVITKGLLRATSYDLTTPGITTTYEHEAAPDTLHPGDSFHAGSIDTGWVLQPLTPYVRIEALRNPAHMMLRVSLWLTALALVLMLMRIVWYREEIVLMSGKVFYRGEFFSEWGRIELQRELMK